MKMSVKFFLMLYEKVTIIFTDGSEKGRRGNCKSHRKSERWVKWTGELQGLNGDFVSLGGFEENRCFYLRNEVIGISVTDTDGHFMKKVIEKPDGRLKISTQDISEGNFFYD
ncbi:MAG: hypothetical protein IJ733_10705 [Lachnospiraceae bacterium]|nr:hypothetical protein [Lachnospiraceae bacterium]